MANPFKESAKKEKVVSQESKSKLPEPADLLSAGKVEESTDSIKDALNSVQGKKKPDKRSSTLYLSNKNLDWLKQKGDELGLSSSEYLDQIITIFRDNL